MSSNNDIFDEATETSSPTSHHSSVDDNPKRGKGFKHNTPPMPPKHIDNHKKNISITKKLGFILIGICSFIALVLIIFVCCIKIPVSDYYEMSKRDFKIPEIGKGFIPQGISYDETSGDFYLTGYENNGSASPIYIVDRENKKLERKILMTNPNGSPSSIHAGGLSYYNGMLYVAGAEASCLYVYNPADIRNASNGDNVSYTSAVDLSMGGDNISVAFTTVHDGLLYVGEFYRNPNYLTNELHHVDTKDGKQRALLVGLNINGDQATPVVAYSLPDQVQGMCFDDKYIYVSTSYGLAFSKIYTYDQSLLKQDGTISVLSTEVPLYKLDSDSLYMEHKTAPMSEEIEIVGNKLYILTESASNKYIFGKLTGANKIYTTDLEKFNKANDK